jgi:hypothetical protein
MSLSDILSSIDAEISRLQQARTLLANIGERGGKSAVSRSNSKRAIGAAARKRIAAAQKKRWAATRKAAKTNAS